MVGYYFKTPGLYDGGWLPPPASRFRAFLLRIGHRLGRHPEFEFGCSLCAARIRAIDKPKMTVIEEGPGTLVTVQVEYTPEQLERFRKRPQRGYRIPFNL